MSKPSRLIALVVVAVAIAVPAFLYAAGAHDGTGAAGAAMAGHWAGGPGHMLHAIVAKLNLTPDQKDKLKAVVTAHKDQLHTQMTQTLQARVNLANAVHADTFDENAIRTAAAALGQAEADAAVLHAQLFAEVRQLLTPEQQAQAKQLLQQHQQHMLDHLQKHSPGSS